MKRMVNGEWVGDMKGQREVNNDRVAVVSGSLGSYGSGIPQRSLRLMLVLVF